MQRRSPRRPNFHQLRDTTHAVRDYLNEIEWDQTERLEKWLITYFGADDTSYHRAIGRKWLLSAVARAYRPGCKADYMLVLEGRQGIMKSAALKALVRDDAWFLEDMRDIQSKDGLIQLGGKWICEIPELQAFRGVRVVARLKGFVSNQVDEYRPPYARLREAFPRSVVFAGTTNEDEYLEDPTGGRRFWCFKCGKIDLLGLRRDRDQLWAEARTAYQDGEHWWIEDEEIIQQAQDEQENRREEDPWEEPIEAYLEGCTSTTIDAVLTHLETTTGMYASARPKIARGKDHQMRVAAILRQLGWERVQKGKRRTRSWKKKEDQNETKRQKQTKRICAICGKQACLYGPDGNFCADHMEPAQRSNVEPLRRR